MNENSLICRFIKENPDDFLTLLHKNSPHRSFSAVGIFNTLHKYATREFRV